MKKNLAKLCVTSLMLTGISAIAGAVVPACATSEMYCIPSVGGYGVVYEKTSGDECVEITSDTVRMEFFGSAPPGSDANAQPEWNAVKVTIANSFLADLSAAAACHGDTDDKNLLYSTGTYGAERPDPIAGTCVLDGGGDPAGLKVDGHDQQGEPPADEGFVARQTDDQQDDTSTTGDEVVTTAEDDSDVTADSDDTSVDATGDETGDDTTADDTAADDTTPIEYCPATEAHDLKVEWSDIKMLITADAQGTQFEGTMTVSGDDCEATYSAKGVYPAVTCVTEDDCEDENNGINPSFDLVCAKPKGAKKADSGMCTLANPLPSYEGVI